MRRDNKDIIKYVNKGSSGGVIKVVAFAIVIMLVLSVLLWYIGSVINTEDGGIWNPRPDREQTMEGDFVPGTSEADSSPVVANPDVALTGTHYWENGGLLELPINGATGWAAASRVTVRTEANANASAVVTLSAGDGFTILEGSGNWWLVEVSPTVIGWVDNRQCFINLPDVIPSIIYQNTNSSGSIKVSLGYHIPGVTGESLYSAWAFNERLGREEYIVPGMYSLARSLFVAQQAAMERGNSLIVNEVFRPRSAQLAVVSGMQQLMRTNPEVNTAISSPPWSLTFFISTGISRHQRGAAVDASIATIRTYEYRQTGDFIFRQMTDYREFSMPSGLHELSPWSAIFDAPRSITAAQMLTGNIEMRDTVTTGVRRLQEAFARGGFTPLSSEWWHFDHADSLTLATNSGIMGTFYTPTIYSRPPVVPQGDE